YGPSWKVVAVIDDRRIDYPRSPDRRPLHEPRTPMDDDVHAVQADELRLLHLQFALRRRNQMKQAWYRSIEWLDHRATAHDINAQYAITMAPFYVRTEPVPPAWLAGLSLPPASVDDE